MIKAVIFDLGGILVPEKGNLIENEISKFLGITHIKFSSFLKNEKSKLTKGEITLLEFYKLLNNKLKLKKDTNQILQKHIKLYEENCTFRDTNIISLIQKLKDKYNVVALTNTEIEIAEYNRKNGLFDFFNESFLSTEMKMMKPEKEIYLEVIKKLGYNSNEVIFIDDKYENIETAKELGFKGIIYENFEQLKNELKKLGIKNA